MSEREARTTRAAGLVATVMLVVGVVMAVAVLRPLWQATATWAAASDAARGSTEVEHDAVLRPGRLIAGFVTGLTIPGPFRDLADAGSPDGTASWDDVVDAMAATTADTSPRAVARSTMRSLLVVHPDGLLARDLASLEALVGPTFAIDLIEYAVPGATSTHVGTMPVTDDAAGALDELDARLLASLAENLDVRTAAEPTAASTDAYRREVEAQRRLLAERRYTTHGVWLRPAGGRMSTADVEQTLARLTDAGFLYALLPHGHAPGLVPPTT